MTAFHVFLVVIGLSIIGISYIISEKITLMNGQKKENPNNITTDLEIANLKEQINLVIKEEIDLAMFKTKDSLSQISNEKIIAVSEYSDQVLEKINQNHTEVVFLYNMLNEKEEAIKKTFNNNNNINNNNIKTVKKSELNNGSGQRFNNQIEFNENSRKVKDPKLEMTQDIMDQKVKNEQILKLYSEGKSIVEIAKMLEIGQGEIKLVIGLSKGEKA